MAAYFGKFARTEDYANEDLPPVNYAYHLDAGRYAAFLRRFAEERGVVRQEGKVADVALDGESGFVTGVTLDDGRAVRGRPVHRLLGLPGPADRTGAEDRL